MAFAKKIWRDLICDFPNRRILTKSDASTEVVNVQKSLGTVTQEGDAWSAQNMNDLEQRIENAFGDVGEDIEALQSQSVSYEDMKWQYYTGASNVWDGFTLNLEPDADSYEWMCVFGYRETFGENHMLVTRIYTDAYQTLQSLMSATSDMNCVIDVATAADKTASLQLIYTPGVGGRGYSFKLRGSLSGVNSYAYKVFRRSNLNILR